MITAVADTHAVVWYLFSDPRLSETARQVIDEAIDGGNQIGISAISLIEIVYLVEKGRIPAQTFADLAALLQAEPALLKEIPVNLQVANALAQIDRAQIPDMPDRIIAATARALNVPLISRDGRIQLSDVETIW